MITLVSHDNHRVELPEAVAKLSTMVKNALGDEDADEDMDTGDNDTHREVELPRVGKDCLVRVCEFLTHYAEEPMKEVSTPLGAQSFEEAMDQEWYRSFVHEDNMSREMLFEILTAANFMEIKPLLELTCLKVTFELTGKTTEQIREMLKLPKRTPEEERKAREEHRWIFDEE